ncbi:MAG: hypothetical protein IPO83_18775 [Chitinophagaceae bacterium]|nr:hypothetical protein [Chitinophagaceae bacterium]
METKPATETIRSPDIESPAETQVVNQDTRVHVSPNPSNGNFVVRFIAPESGKAGITIKDSKDNGVLSIETATTAGKNAVPINITGYAPGIYSVTVSGAGAYGTVSVTVE